MEAFDEYVNQFDMNDITLKNRYDHSYRVAKLMKDLTQSYAFGAHEIKLAEQIGLLHDIGRFRVSNKEMNETPEQLNYVEYGLHVLFNEGLIKKFDIREEDYDIVKKCILLHNKYSVRIDSYDSKYSDFFTLLLRDCDKIDFMNMWATEERVDIKSDGEVSPLVKEEFDDRSVIHNRNRQTNADNIVAVLSYVYDINYINSLLYIYDNDIIEKLYSRVDNKDELNDYFNKVTDYVETKVREERGYVREKVQPFRGRKEQI